mgnify:FL=1
MNLECWNVLVYTLITHTDRIRNMWSDFNIPISLMFIITCNLCINVAMLTFFIIEFVTVSVSNIDDLKRFC